MLYFNLPVFLHWSLWLPYADNHIFRYKMNLLEWYEISFKKMLRYFYKGLHRGGRKEILTPFKDDSFFKLRKSTGVFLLTIKWTASYCLHHLHAKRLPVRLHPAIMCNWMFEKQLLFNITNAFQSQTKREGRNSGYLLWFFGTSCRVFCQ